MGGGGDGSKRLATPDSLLTIRKALARLTIAVPLALGSYAALLVCVEDRFAEVAMACDCGMKHADSPLKEPGLIRIYVTATCIPGERVVVDQVCEPLRVIFLASGLNLEKG